LIITQRQNTRFILYGLGAGAVILLGFSPWIPVVLYDSSNWGHWMNLPEWFFPFMYYYIYLGKEPFLAVVYIILAYGFVKYARQQKNQQRPDYAAKVHLAVLGLWVVLSYLSPLIYSLIKKPILHERYTIIALPALFVLVSLGLSLIPKRQIRTAILVTIFISTAINLIFFNRYYTRLTKNQFREVSQEVIKRNTDHAKVFSDQAWHYGFYFRQYKAPDPLNDALGVDFEKALASEQQVWILRGHVLNEVEKGVDETQQKYLDEHFELKDQVIGQNAFAYLYQRK
jgi:hypothetical protein